jgi:hypothetical protein
MAAPLNPVGKLEAAWQRLADESRRLNAQAVCSVEDVTRLVGMYEDIARARRRGEFEEAFVLVAVPPDGVPFDPAAPTPVSHRIKVLSWPYLILNHGDGRNGQAAERVLRDMLWEWPTIGPDLIETVDLFYVYRNPAFNGAAREEVGAFLLNHAGRRAAVEYR